MHFVQANLLCLKPFQKLRLHYHIVPTYNNNIQVGNNRFEKQNLLYPHAFEDIQVPR